MDKEDIQSARDEFERSFTEILERFERKIGTEVSFIDILRKGGGYNVTVNITLRGESPGVGELRKTLNRKSLLSRLLDAIRGL